MVICLAFGMPRAARVAPGGMIYHVLNRGNDRRTIFGNEDDYAAFLRLFGQTQEAAPMRVLAYCLLSNIGISERADQWRWCSLAQRVGRQRLDETVQLCDWPIPRPTNWVGLLNAVQTEGESGRLAQVGSTRLPVRRRGLATEHRQATRLGVHAAPPRATAKETLSVPGNQRNWTYPLPGRSCGGGRVSSATRGLCGTAYSHTARKRWSW